MLIWWVYLSFHNPWDDLDFFYLSMYYEYICIVILTHNQKLYEWYQIKQKLNLLISHVLRIYVNTACNKVTFYSLLRLEFLHFPMFHY